MSEQKEMGGFMLPQGLIEEYRTICRARLRVLDRLFPGMEKDPVYKAMKEVARDWDQVGSGELDWHTCAVAARKLVKIRKEAN